MEKEMIFSPIFQGNYERIRHDSGLTLLLCPMEGFSSTHAWMTTRYGSVDTHFRIDPKENYLQVPEGIAHFLEHKLFEDEDGDAFLRFSQMGGDANAFTSYGQTTYLVECTSQFRENLEILLKMVTTPFFTEQAVEKERGIIGQEIKMYMDDPDSRLEYNLLQALYQNHPLRIDIAGTVESIEEITPKLLYDCYQTFYNLNNMVLVVAGNFTVDEVLGVCDKVIKKSPILTINREIIEEPKAVVKHYISEKKAVSQPLFAMGFKNSELPPDEYAKLTAGQAILLELLVGESSPLFTRLYESGLVTTPISAYGFEERGAFPMILSGEAENPEAVIEAIQKEILRFKENGIEPSQVERVKRQIYGRIIMSLDSVRTVTALLTSGFLEKRDPFLLASTYQNVGLSDVEEALQRFFDFDKMAISVIEPDGK